MNTEETTQALMEKSKVSRLRPTNRPVCQHGHGIHAPSFPLVYAPPRSVLYERASNIPHQEMEEWRNSSTIFEGAAVSCHTRVSSHARELQPPSFCHSYKFLPSFLGVAAASTSTPPPPQPLHPSLRCFSLSQHATQTRIQNVHVHMLSAKPL